MELTPVSCRNADPVALAVALSALIQHAPAAATARTLEMIRARVDDREWTRLMAAIAPLPL
jgi:hypothetical protein